MEEKNWREIEITVDTEEIAEFFFHKLLERGLVVKEEDLEAIADVTFDWLLDKNIIDEEEK
jgi:hypothetical protein